MNKKYIVAVHKALGLTFLRYQKISVVFGNNWDRFWRASLSELMETNLTKKEIERFVVARAKIDIEADWAYLQSNRISVLFFEDLDFPVSLKHIYNPPVVLFVRGQLKASDFPCVAVVGARNVSDYGKRSVTKIVADLASAGVTIVSGLALGTDFCAHKIAVENGARTIAVLGNAIDSVYPKAHEYFAKQIIENDSGVLISEYLPGAQTRPSNFPQRNRIVSGLSVATVVIEAAEKSGSLITARLVNEQNKDLFVVPGSIFSKNSVGTNQLLVSGEAAPIVSGAQLLTQLNIRRGQEATQAVKRSFQHTTLEQNILQILSENEQLHIDEIINLVPNKSTETVSALAILEIKGCVRNSGKQIYHSTI